MKRILLFLALTASLAANAYLLLRPTPSSPPITPHPSPLTSHAPSVPSLTTADWENLQSGQPEAIARLKQAGIPIELIRRVLRLQIDAQFADRERALRAARENFPYWRETQNGRSRYQNTNYKAELELRREKEAALKALLGDDYLDPAANNNRYADYLPPEKALQLSRIREDYSTLRAPLQAMSRVTFPEDREQIAYLEKQERADLAALLTPEELRAYDLRESPTARRLQWDLATLQPNEQEYLAIFEAQRAFDEKFPRTTSRTDPSVAEARQAAQAAADEQIKAALSPERYADYERAKDFNYRQLHDLGQRLNLPAQQINAAFDYSKTLSTRMRDIASTSKASPQERAAQLDALAAEATQTLKQHLGPDGFSAYAKTDFNLRNIQTTAELLRKAPPVPAPKPRS